MIPKFCFEKRERTKPLHKPRQCALPCNNVFMNPNLGIRVLHTSFPAAHLRLTQRRRCRKFFFLALTCRLCVFLTLLAPLAFPVGFVPFSEYSLRRLRIFCVPGRCLNFYAMQQQRRVGSSAESCPLLRCWRANG